MPHKTRKKAPNSGTVVGLSVVATVCLTSAIGATYYATTVKQELNDRLYRRGIEGDSARERRRGAQEQLEWAYDRKRRVESAVVQGRHTLTVVSEKLPKEIEELRARDNDIDFLRSRLQEFENRTCPICMNVEMNDQNRVKFPCGHTLCRKCRENMRQNDYRNCHICREAIPA